MVRNFLIALLAVVVTTGEAAADMTARYRTGGGDALIVQVNDRGDSRISRGSTTVLTIDGVSYVVVSTRDGEFATRQVELVAEVRRRTNERFPEGPSPLLLRTDSYAAVADGSETVGGRSGVRWTLRRGEEDTPEEAEIFVISGDADLAMLGRALATQFTTAEYTIFQSDSPELGLGRVPASLLRVIAAGAVIRVGTMFSLEDVQTGRLPASAFILTAPVLPADRFLARAPWLPLAIID